ncbi:MAG: ABC transporter substrate-binding protein, partial [Oscillospiraceae bacterium]
MNNRKTLIKAICILSAAALTAGMFTACGKKSGEDSSSSADNSAVGGDTSKNAAKLVRLEYKCDELTLCDELKEDYFDSFSVSDSGVILIKNDYNWDEETYVSTTKTYLYNLDLDGNIVSKNDISVEKLNDQDSASVGNVNYLDDGSILFIENHYYPDYSSADTASADSGEDGTAAEDDTSDYEVMTVQEEDSAVTEADDYAYEYEEEVQYRNSMYLVHMSADGEVISREDFADIPALKLLADSQNTYVQSIRTNSSGDISVYFQTYDEEWNCINGVVILNNELESVFSKNFEGDNTWVNGSFADSEGNFCFVVYEYNEEKGVSTQNVKKCNIGTGEFEDVFDWSSSGAMDNMINGSGEYQSYYYDYNSQSIMGLKNDGSADVMINLLTNGLYVNQINSMSIQGEDFYILSYDYTKGETVIYKLKKLDESEVKEKEEVTLASYYSSTELSSAVAEYNRSDGNYLITVTEYSQYNDYSTDDEEAWNAGLTRLNSEISSGQIPDIISISDPEMLSSLASKGLFADLNTFIDGENGIDRNDYFDNIFRAMENDGKLYTITSMVSIQGMCAKKSLIPEDGTVSWETVDEILGANSGMTLLSADNTRGRFIESTLSSGYRNFVNTSTGECSFNSPEFVEILERSKDYPEEIDYEELEASDPDFWNNYNIQYRDGKVLMNNIYLYGFDSYYYTADGNMGEDISLIGMPGSGSGAYLVPTSYISVSAKSAHPDAGWELIKSMIEYDEDRYSGRNSYYSYSGFPVNKQSYQSLGEAAVEAGYYIDEDDNKVAMENTYYINDTESVVLRNTDQA